MNTDLTAALTQRKKRVAKSRAEELTLAEGEHDDDRDVREYNQQHLRDDEDMGPKVYHRIDIFDLRSAGESSDDLKSKMSIEDKEEEPGPGIGALHQAHRC